MIKSSKFLFGLIISIMPIFLILGFARMIVNQNQDFLMTPLEFQNLFLSMPNFLNSFKSDLSKISNLITNSNYNVSSLSINPNSLIKAWASIGGIDAIADLGVALGETFTFAFNAVQQFFVAISGYFVAFGYCFVLIFDIVKIPVEFLVWFIFNFLGFATN